MNYARNYLNASSLADRIREASTKGEKVTLAAGLGAREEPKRIEMEEPDFEQVRAQYMNTVRDMFKQPELPASEANLSFGKGPAPIQSTNAADYSLGETGTGGDFLSRLIQSESSGNPQAMYRTSEGDSYVGLIQIGKARLDDYNKATKSNVEQADILQNKDIEQDVISWHIKDLTQQAEKLSAETGLDTQGLIAVGHLGGRTGMTKFAKSGGKYNKSDELGTSLMDYYTKFKG